MITARNLLSSGRNRTKFRLEQLETRQLLAATLPVLPAIVAPTSNPALPSNFDVFSPVGVAGMAAAGSPAIAQWTQSGNPNDTIAVSVTHPTALPAGSNSSDTQFFTYGQTTTSKGALVNDTIEQLGAGVASVNLSSSNTPNSMYLLWAENADGYSSAVAVNKANAWWVGPDQASAGQTVSVYGQNMTFSPTDGLSWVYITKAGSSTGQWATVNSANPYQVSFVVPAGLASGNYQVWVHNGHGGEYGWSSPVTLDVVAAAAANGPVFNVLSYGAVGNGVTDNTAAFQAAIDAAAKYPGATVYAPTGNYMISQIFMLPGVQLTGDGAGKTNLIEIPPASGAAPTAMVWLNSNSGIENLTLNSNNVAVQDAVYGRFLTNIHFSGVTFDNNLTDDMDIHGDQLVFVDNCNLIGCSNFLGTASQVFFNHDNFYAVNDAGEMLYSWGGDDISITNCTVQDLNNSNPNSGAGWGQGRFFVGNNNWGSQSDTYIADNTTIDMGVRPTYNDQNAGEQLLWEAAPLVTGGNYVSATANTVTYTGLPSTVGTGYNAIIVSGDGVGEYVPISSYNPTTGVITLAGTWAALPDSTSVIRVGMIFDNIAVYDNTLQGKGVTNTASTGVQFWGGAINCVVDSNTISDTRYGINDVAQYSGGNVIPAYFNLIQNNTITNVESGIMLVNAGISNQIGNIGSVVRFNDISELSPGFGAFLLKDYDNVGSPFYLIIEGNTIAGAPVGLYVENFGTAPTLLTLTDNSFSLSSGTAAGSMGLDITQELTLTQAGNTFTGFAQTDGGNVTATIVSPMAAAPGSQSPPTNGLDGSSGSTSTDGSTSSTTGASGTTGSTTSTGSTGKTTTKSPPAKSKQNGKKENSIRAAAQTTFAAVITPAPNNLQTPAKKQGADAAVLAA